MPGSTPPGGVSPGRSRLLEHQGTFNGADIARREPGSAAVLLIAPFAYFGITWVPSELVGDHPFSSAIGLVAVFTAPAIVAAGLILAGGRAPHQGSRPPTPRDIVRS